MNDKMKSDSDLLDLSLEELAAKREEVDMIFKLKFDEERGQALAKIMEYMLKYEISADDIKKHHTGVTRKAQSKSKRKSMEPKYQNPANPEETWAGTGNKPKWLRENLEKGAKVDDFLIKKEGSAKA
jgi:DNA-binding protein H-NS